MLNNTTSTAEQVDPNTLRIETHGTDENNREVTLVQYEDVDEIYLPQQISIPAKYPIRIGQMVFAALALALGAAAIAGTLKYKRDPEFAYTDYYACDALVVATASLTLLITPLLLIEVLPTKTKMVNKWIYVSIDLVLACLWMASFVSLAVQHANTDCEIIHAKPDFCEIGKGNAAVSAVCFALFIIGAMLVFKHMYQHRHKDGNNNDQEAKEQENADIGPQPQPANY